MSYDKDNIKESLSIEDISSIVEDLGAATPVQKGEILLCETICHNLPGEGSNKLYYYDNTKLFKCYTGCGDEFFDIFQLIQKSFENQYGEEWSLPRAVAWVAQKFGFESIYEDGFEDTLEDWGIFKAYERLEVKVSKGTRTVELKEYDDSIVKNLPKAILDPWLKEGISQDTLNKYCIGYYPTDCQITIPHYDAQGRFVGLRGRDLSEEDSALYGKYKPLRLANGFMYNHPLGFTLYGFDKNKDNISIVKKAIVFEGEKSVLLYDTYFGSENNIAVASCGFSLTSHQASLLLEAGVTEIVIAFDRQFEEIGDKEHTSYTSKLTKLAEKFRGYVTVSCLYDRNGLLNHKSSPIDHGRDTFLQLFKDRIFL